MLLDTTPAISDDNYMIRFNKSAMVIYYFLVSFLLVPSLLSTGGLKFNL